MDSDYVFGAFKSTQDFVDYADVGLKTPVAGATPTPDGYYFDGLSTNEDDVRRSPSFYEIDSSMPIAPQVDFRNMTMFVNQPALAEYHRIAEDLFAKMDLGGVTEKDRIKPTQDPNGIFSFGLASPSLYRVVEWYIPDLQRLVDMASPEESNITTRRNSASDIRFYTKVQGKQYAVRRQQKGTYDIEQACKRMNKPCAIEELPNTPCFYISNPKAVKEHGIEYKLKFATRQKKIYLIRPKKGGDAKYIDLFVITGGNADMTSEGMLAKIAPVMMVAQQLEQAGVKVRVYGLRATYTGANGGKIMMVSWVIKEYGAQIDPNNIAVYVSDPRFFRYTIFRASEGFARRKTGFNFNAGRTRTIYGNTTEFITAFDRYKNYLYDQKIKGLFDTKVKERALFIAGGLGNPSNNMSRQRNAIENEFYRISDVAEIALSSNMDKSIRRIVQRERDRGKTDREIKQQLVQSINSAFLTITPAQSTLYQTPREDAERMEKREQDIIRVINSILP